MLSIGPLDLKTKAAVVATIGEKPLETAKKAASLGADVLELRLDLAGIKTPEAAAGIIGKLKSETGLPLLVTNRSPEEGGKWEGSEGERIGLLKALLFSEEKGKGDSAPGLSPSSASLDAVDIELSAEKTLRDELIRATKDQGKTVIISYHDFSKTPTVQEMKKILEKAFHAGANIAKLAVMPLSGEDVLSLLRVTLEARNENRPVCTIAMGELGKHTRVIAPFYGSLLTYASVEKAAAPGQLRVDRVKTAMEFLGVTGENNRK